MFWLFRLCRFLSTLSLRRATTGFDSGDMVPAISIHALLAESDNSLLTSVVSSADFYPRSPCGERPYGALKHVHQTEISIHALLAESDPRSGGPWQAEYRISIHALLAESDLAVADLGKRNIGFLSTLSLRRATNNVLPAYAACGISIHALLAESDHWEYWIGGYGTAFLSTLSLRRATSAAKCR